MRTLVLCYHSQILGGNEYGNNGHVAPASDLEVIHASGALIVPARWVADWVHGTVGPDDDRPRVALTFDDWSILDFASTQHPGLGTQLGLQRILRDFHRRNGNVQPTLHATSFVIGSEQARVEMDQRGRYGRGWMSATWWKEGEESGLIEIGNHSWNHTNPVCSDVPATTIGFESVNDFDSCHLQVARAGRAIAAVTGHQPRLFAYPYGQSSAYLREHYLPTHRDEHGLRGAFSTAGHYVERDSSPWAIPRFVHGEHWQSPDALAALLEGASISNRASP